MSGLEIGGLSVLALVLLVWLGMHVAVALTLVSGLGVWIVRDSLEIAVQMLSLAATDAIASYDFGVIPLFVLMGMFVSLSDTGRDIFEVANHAFRKMRAGLGIATVAANAVFAAITGVSIASASVFTRIAVPEMIRFGYKPRFAVGVVAGSSVLGMLIPPSLLFIIFGILAETSIGDLFLAGIIPGIVLSLAFVVQILVRAYVFPDSIGGMDRVADANPDAPAPSPLRIVPAIGLILLVLGGIYGGLFTPTEAGAVGAAGAMAIAIAKRRLGARSLWSVLVETGHVTASIGLIIIAAHMYARMLAVAGIPTLFGETLATLDIGLYGTLAIYVALIILLGTIIDAASIMLIAVPLFLPVMLAFGVDVVWFGVVTVLAVEIGMLTPPFGIAVFVIRNNLQRDDLGVGEIFRGAAPFAFTLFLVLLLVIAVPWFALAFIR